MGEWREIITRRFPQPYNHQNALAAIAVAEVFKLKKHVIAQAIASFPGVVGRMQSIDNSRGFNIIVDFAHTPNALTQALGALKSQYSGRIIAVFGAAGLRDATKRPLMGQAASSLADEIILTSEDPRTEDPRIIIQQIKSGVKTNHGHVHGIINRREAIAFALKLAHQGDCIGIFGKGHEQSINLDGTHELPWSDVDTVRQLLKIPNH